MPSEFGSLLHCTDLRIHANPDITGPIPDESFNMKGLEYLDVYAMNLNGTLSTRVGELVDLRHLKVSENRLTGPIPSEIQELNSLQLFWSHLNLFTGSMPKEICNNVAPKKLVFLQADCDPTGDSAVPCLCCSDCCDRDSQICVERQ
jgi:hypothetical protein